MKRSHYLQSRILFSILIFIALIGMIVAILSSFLYKNYLQRSLLTNTEVNLQFLADTIDANMDSVKKLISFSQSNTTIGDYVDASKSKTSVLSLKAFERLNIELESNDAKKYVHRLIISSTEDYYLQVVPTVFSSFKNSAIVAKNLPYFNDLINQTG